MKNEILIKIDAINNYIDENIKSNKDISLCNGIGSFPIFYYLQFKLSNDKQFINKIHDLIFRIIQIINESEITLSYCNGIIGVAHVFNYLKKQNILNHETLVDIEDALFTIDENVVDYSISQTETIEDIDFLHGAFGAALYLIERVEDNSNVIFRDKVVQLFEILSNIVLEDIQNTKSVSDLIDFNEHTHTTNCGLAHGHISYIIIFSKFLKKFPQNILIREVLEKSVNTVLEFESNDKSKFSQFPSIAVNKLNANYSTNLGWCYGDQTISLGLHTASDVLNDNFLKAKALDLAYKNLERNSIGKIFSNSDKFDACFCHGLSSVAYIHKKWYLISKNKDFYKEYEKLISDVLNFGENKKGIAGYQKYLGDGTYINSIGLLDGAIGIGMVLIDYLLEFEDCGWDNFFLLDVNN